MKLLAARAGPDVDDIETLYRICGYTTVDEGLHLIERSYPDARILPKTQYMLAEIVESLDEEG